MFTTLAKERHQRMVNITHNKLIRESVLDLVEDEETGAVGIDSQPLLMDPETNISDDVLDSIESKVEEVIAGQDISNMTDEQLDVLADQIISSLGTIDN